MIVLTLLAFYQGLDWLAPNAIPSGNPEQRESETAGACQETTWPTNEGAVARDPAAG